MMSRWGNKHPFRQRNNALFVRLAMQREELFGELGGGKDADGQDTDLMWYDEIHKQVGLIR